MSEQMVRADSSLDVAVLLRRAWDQFFNKPVEHIVSSLVLIVLGALSLGILAGPLGVGYIRMIDKQRRGEPIAINDVFGGFDAFGSALWVTVLSVLGIALGLGCLVVPGLFLIAAWGFALWFVALEGGTASDALGSSWGLLKRQRGSVVVVMLIAVVLNAVGSAFVLAPLLTVPFAFVFMTLSFRQLTDTAASS